MKPTSILSKGTIFHYVFLSLATLGLSFSLINYFISGKPNTALLIIMTCLFVASLAAWFRTYLSK
ncbi:hypothetical protein [Flavobacterium tegetincola]|uniref:hypothetical protein n=1 Tax=Flavobacterium tegetincola TaxID=150172 RepID=UPI000416591F|nr:hypothetical protein [Flavobacterium tegetincola]